MMQNGLRIFTHSLFVQRKEVYKMSECSHNCETCGKSCSDRTAESLLAPQNAFSQVKKVIGVVSGKGGVGKSLVSGLLAAACNKKGLRTAVLDADITGPSIPKMFGITENAKGNDDGIFPVKTKDGISLMSINLLLENQTDPVIWRGPVIGGTVKQFWTDVIWGDIDVMFIDMPPGTGDVPLTVFQSIPVDAIVVVTSPQELVSMIVEKAVKMAKMMNIGVLGLVENMSYVLCPDCGKKIEVFGKSKADETAKANDIETVAKMPFMPEIAALCDAGKVEDSNVDALDEIVNKIIGLE